MNLIEKAKEMGLSFVSEENGKPCHKHLINGNEVCGVTSVSGLFSSDGWKFQWPANLCSEYTIDAFQEVLEEVGNDDISFAMEQIVTEAKNAWREKRDKSADTGTIAHDFISKWIKVLVEKEPSFATMPLINDPEVQNCFNQFMLWQNNVTPTWFYSEVQVGSLKHNYGGILDALCEINGKLTLLDFKTGTSIKDDASIQLAGLCICLEEMGLYEPNNPIQRAILHLPKTGKYEFRPITSDLEWEKKAFLSGLSHLHYKNQFLGKND